MKARYVAALGAAVLVVALVPSGATQASPRKPGSTEQMEVFEPTGEIRRETVRRPASDRAPASDANLRAAAPQVIPIEVNGPSTSRYDLVFVGDGYTSGEIAKYGQQVRSKVEEIFALEPFKTYRKQFNIYQVNVVSSVSGVTNDPKGVQRNTPLGMYFHCGNIARLLCVNETRARQYAAYAPDADQILALANSSTYGGAGGGVATASGGHASSGQIAIHELGHSIGGLADEYTYGTCNTREPREPNATTYNAAQLRQYQYKWYRYLGQQSPDGGVVDTYVGGRYCTSGMYRPTENSIMRTLGRQFNLPGRDAMIAGFHRER